MTYRFVQARYDAYGNRTVTKALCVHMTEGSGTEADVDYLAGFPDRGVSVHFVILKTGEIVQMLGWDRIAGSIDPNQLRTTNDPTYTSPDGAAVTYGVDVRTAVMGAWVNGGVLAVEIGGHAADGPNAAQSASLVALVADARSRYPGLPVLGHRDFTSTKPCPGHLIRWGSLGGHGVPVTEDPMLTKIKAEDFRPAAGHASAPFRATPDRTVAGTGAITGPVRTLGELDAGGENWRVTRIAGLVVYLLRSDLEPLVAGGDPATDQALGAFLDRTPAPSATYPVTGSITVGGKAVSVTGSVQLP